MLFKKKRDPFDCTKRDLQWFKSPEGKQAYEEYIKYFDEMIYAWKESGIEVIMSCNDSNSRYGYCEKRWPCAYFCEFLSAYGIAGPELHYPLTTMMLSEISIKNYDGVMHVPYPDVFDKNKNPILYFVSNCHHFLFFELECHIVKTLLFYIYNGVQKNMDYSKEKWLYDRNLFYDSRNLYIGDAKAYEIVKKYAKHKEDIPDM